MANWIPQIYNFAVKNEYDVRESRAILHFFHQRFPFSHLSSRVRLWPRNLEQQLVVDLQLSEGKGAELRRLGQQHGETRVFLLQGMVKRIRASDKEQEREARRIEDLELYERNKRAWFRQRLASRKMRFRRWRQQREVWIQRNFRCYQFPNGVKLYVSRY